MDDLDDWLFDPGRELSVEIREAATDARLASLFAKEGELEAQIAHCHQRIDEERATATKCVLIALKARGRGRSDLAAAARDREQLHLEEAVRLKDDIARLEAALAKLRTVLATLPRPADTT